MAKVKIQGNASGTGVLTVTAPNTSTDRTITLPDSTGTLATTDDNGSQLDHSGSKKIEATATGVDVTGIAVTDGITSSGNITFDNGNSSVSIKSDGANGSYIQYGTDEYLRFLYDNGANETMRLHDSGYVTMPQGVTLGNGSTYAAANTLHDYEEGTWTPSFSGNIAFSTKMHFTYTKIGSLVHVTGYCNNASGTFGTSWSVSGLPYTSSGSYNTAPLWSHGQDQDYMMYMPHNTSTFNIRDRDGANMDSMAEISFDCTYLTNQ